MLLLKFCSYKLSFRAMTSYKAECRPSLHISNISTWQLPHIGPVLVGGGIRYRNVQHLYTVQWKLFLTDVTSGNVSWLYMTFEQIIKSEKLAACVLFHCLHVWEAQVRNWLDSPQTESEKKRKNENNSDTNTKAHTFSKPYIFISGYLISYAAWDWAECAHSCISITDHITEPQTIPLLIFTIYPEQWAFLGRVFFPHWSLIGCNYSSTKQMSVLRLPWRLDQGTQQCETFTGLHLYW